MNKISAATIAISLFVGTIAHAQSCGTTVECAQAALEAAETTQIKLGDLERQIRELESRVDGIRLASRRIGDDSPGNSKTVTCAADEVITSCVAYMTPSGSSLCGVSVSNNGRSCSTAGCGLPAGQKYTIVADCSKVVP